MTRKAACFVMMAILLGFLVSSSSLTGTRKGALKSTPPDTLSFSKHILPLIQVKCNSTECHGEAQYPPLADYKKVRKFAGTIRFRIQYKKKPMPPIDAKESLSAQELKNIITWIERGAKNN